MLAGAAVLSPFLFFLVDLVPSRENTSLDELPYMAFTTVLSALGVAGIARIGHALMTERKRPELSSPTSLDHLQQFERGEQLLPPAVDPRLSRIEHNTPA